MKNKASEELANLEIDDSTTVVEVPTPKGWKCKRIKCRMNVYHSHTTYDFISNKHSNKTSKR